MTDSPSAPGAGDGAAPAPPRADNAATVARARELFAGKLVLAPMTKGSNTPFRRLCRELGCDVTVGEMALALKVTQRRRGEMALLRAHPQDHPFGAQLADRDAETLAEAAQAAEALGSDFVDLNCGCPIDYFTRKGLGAALLRKPNKIARLVAAMKRAVKIPVTVKIRLGWNESEQNFLEIARIVESEGADAIGVHARTREQRYSRAANWDLIRAVKETVKIPVLGNGDLLTHWEIAEKWSRAGCDAVMLARGALVKPWVFQEAKEKRTIHKNARERLDLLRRWVALAREHFGDDDHGTTRVREFLVWHLEFLCRYRELPESEYHSPEFAHPLLQTRFSSRADQDPLENLLARTDAAAHAHVAKIAMDEIADDTTAPPPADAAAEDAVTTTSNG